MKILIAGAGYVGRELASRYLAQGHEVWGWVFTPESSLRLEAQGIKAICGDLKDTEIWKTKANTDWDLLVFSASTGGGGVPEYVGIHQQALRLALKSSFKTFCYTSSTTVYGETAGEWVDEATSQNPRTETGKIIFDAELRVIEAEGIVARLSGIYGPGRGRHLRRMMRGEVQLDDLENRWLNHVHRDDIVSAVQFLCHLQKGGIWNVTDCEPILLHDLYAWMAEEFGKPLSTRVESTKDTNKRVSNQKLLNVGYRFQYPTIREGYRALARSEGFI